MSAQYMQCTVAEEESCASEIINTASQRHCASILRHLLPARVSTKGEWKHRCTMSLELHRTRNLNQNKQTNKFLAIPSPLHWVFSFKCPEPAHRKRVRWHSSSPWRSHQWNCSSGEKDCMYILWSVQLNIKRFILYHRPICNLTLTITRLQTKNFFLSGLGLVQNW